MNKLRLLLSIAFISAILPLYSQADSGKANSLYEPVAVVQRLSYDNFKKIKQLMTAVINYGGGQAEFDRLVMGYADASSFYFSRDYEKASASFLKNEKDIKETATRLAEKYKIDAEALNKEIIAYNVKVRIKQSLDNKTPTQGMISAEKLISQGSESIAKGNDSLLRTQPVQAIGLYRRSKESSILFWQALKINEYNGQILNDRFAKDNADNKNKVYVAKEKKN